MADIGLPVTPGVGENVAVDQVGSLLYQRMKLDLGGSGANIPATSDGTNGLDVHVKLVDGVVIVNNPTAGNLKVDASGATVPVSSASPLVVTDGGSSLTVDGAVTATVTGSVTAAQGTAAEASAPWPMEITDGANGVVAVATVGGQKALNVNVLAAPGVTAIADKAAFTEGTTNIDVIGAEFNDSPTNPSAGQAAAMRMTQLRALHANLRKNDGTELGVVAAPLRTDPTGTTTQPVSGTVLANVGQVLGSAISAANPVPSQLSAGGVAVSAANPLVTIHRGQGETRVTKSLALSASQTAAAMWTPATGKAFYVRKIVLVVTTAGPLTIFDNTNAASNMLADSGSGANWPTGVFPLDYSEPWASAAINNVLRYTSGAGLVGVLTIHGFEA